MTHDAPELTRLVVALATPYQLDAYLAALESAATPQPAEAATPSPSASSAAPMPIPPAATPAAPAADGARPDWIGVEDWTPLSRLLKATLAGSTRDADGQVRGANAFLDKQLHGRYAPDLARLCGLAEEH